MFIANDNIEGIPHPIGIRNDKKEGFFAIMQNGEEKNIKNKIKKLQKTLCQNENIIFMFI